MRVRRWGVFFLAVSAALAGDLPDPAKTPGAAARRSTFGIPDCVWPVLTEPRRRRVMRWQPSFPTRGKQKSRQSSNRTRGR
jgi:hypothetical protein